jgi:hypothetical protein
MRKLFSVLGVTALFCGLSLAVQADDKEVKEITGEGQCAKCSLKETPKCVNAVVVEEDGKKTTYYMDMENKIAKDFHGKVCQDKVKVKVKGEVTEKDGKKVISPTEEIEVVKED